MVLLQGPAGPVSPSALLACLLRTDDVGPWSDDKLVASLGLDLEDLRLGRAEPPDVRAHLKAKEQEQREEAEVSDLAVLKVGRSVAW